MSTLSVELACKPKIKQYLLNRYGLNQLGQINLPEGDWIKTLAHGFLIRATDDQATKITMNQYTEKVLLPITVYRFERYGSELSKTAMREINCRIEDQINTALYQFLEFYVHVVGYLLKDAVELFQQIYHFPEEVYSRDAILKHYQRNIKPNLSLQKFVGVQLARSSQYRAQNKLQKSLL